MERFNHLKPSQTYNYIDGLKGTSSLETISTFPIGYGQFMGFSLLSTIGYGDLPIPPAPRPTSSWTGTTRRRWPTSARKTQGMGGVLQGTWGPPSHGWFWGRNPMKTGLEPQNGWLRGYPHYQTLGFWVLYKSACAEPNFSHTIWLMTGSRDAGHVSASLSLRGLL